MHLILLNQRLDRFVWNVTCLIVFRYYYYTTIKNSISDISKPTKSKKNICLYCKLINEGCHKYLIGILADTQLMI